jgi:hypothetical protein
VSQEQKEFAVALSAYDRRGLDLERLQSYSNGFGLNGGDDPLVHNRVADEAAAFDFAPARFKLRLDERDHTTLRGEDRRDDGQDARKRDERHVDCHEIEAA